MSPKKSNFKVGSTFVRTPFRNSGLIMELCCRLCRCVNTALAVNLRYPLQTASSPLIPSRWNSNRAAVAKTNRKVYARSYPTVVVNTDGSTFRIKYSEPRKILKLPVDVNMLPHDEKKARLARYQLKKRTQIVDDLDDNFDANRYKHLWNKRK